MRFSIRLLCALPLCFLAGLAILRTVRVAYAEDLAQQDTVEALQAALRIEPGNATYHARIATLDASHEEELHTALNLNATESGWWIMQAVRQEEEGDIAGAEKSLLQANQVSRYYVPRWSLAAFYYRQQNREKLGKWARLALSSGYGTPDSLFQMAQKLGLSPEEIRREVVPPQAESVEGYLRFIMKTATPEELYRTAVQLLSLGTKENRRQVLLACDTIFLANHITEAVDLWNRTIRAGWVTSAPIELTAGKPLGRPDFSGESLEGGFDWKYPIQPEVPMTVSGADGSLRLEFSGKQPEQCDLVNRYIPLLPRKRYRLTVKYRAEGIAAGSGLQWSVVPTSSGPAVFNSLLKLPEGQSGEESFTVDAPEKQTPMKLLLSYVRAQGTTRIEGTLVIESVQLTLLS